MKIEINDKRKEITAWLNDEEAQSLALRDWLKRALDEYKEKGYSAKVLAPDSGDCDYVLQII